MLQLRTGSKQSFAIAFEYESGISKVFSGWPAHTAGKLAQSKL
jgi:hypothetical protein